jgi:glucose-6-phosphate isomerase
MILNPAAEAAVVDNLKGLLTPIEEIKEQERIRHEKARLRAKRIQRIEDIITLGIGGAVIGGMLYGIWWMFSLVLAVPK